MDDTESTLKKFYFYGFAGGMNDWQPRYSNPEKILNRCFRRYAGRRFSAFCFCFELSAPWEAYAIS